MERIRHVLFASLGRSKLQFVVLHIAIMKPTNNVLYVRKEPSSKVVQVRDKEWQSFVLKDCDCPLSILRYMRFGLADYQLFFSPIPSSLRSNLVTMIIYVKTDVFSPGKSIRITLKPLADPSTSSQLRHGQECRVAVSHGSPKENAGTEWHVSAETL